MQQHDPGIRMAVWKTGGWMDHTGGHQPRSARRVDHASLAALLGGLGPTRPVPGLTGELLGRLVQARAATVTLGIPGPTAAMPDLQLRRSPGRCGCVIGLGGDVPGVDHDREPSAGSSVTGSRARMVLAIGATRTSASSRDLAVRRLETRTAGRDAAFSGIDTVLAEL
jgi:hypothetical protein